MRKRKILFCSEASFLNTGYANYTKRVLEELHNTGKYELAEMGAFGQRNDPKGMSLPWKYYGVAPNIDYQPKASKEEINFYQSSVYNSFGAGIFEEVCLNFRPDIVFDIRDYWMTSFIDESPFRDYYRFVLMPTVDAAPQARHWMDMYKRADAVFSYSEWAGKVLKEQSGGRINYIGTASPLADNVFHPGIKSTSRSYLNIPEDAIVIGTVMRNQRRKLFPDLFDAFSKFLKKVDNPEKYFLYCHTGYPDMGWEIPELLQEYNLESKVYFTYKHESSGQICAAFYNGPKCNELNFCGVKNGITNVQLSKIYNSFDLYIQYANSEGFGIPLAEASACGIPICAIDYSAMSSILDNLGGVRLKPKGFYKELETGCYRAVPDNEDTANKLVEFFKDYNGLDKKDSYIYRKDIASTYEKVYNKNTTIDPLINCFDNIPIKDERKTWDSPPKIFQPQPYNSLSNIEAKDAARWLILNVLGDKSKINTFFEARLIRDIKYGYKTNTVNSMYLNESSAAFDGKKDILRFTIKDAYNELKKIRDKINYWEGRRVR